MTFRHVPNGVYIDREVLRLDGSFPRPRRHRNRLRRHAIYAAVPPWPLRILAALFAHLRRFAQ